MQSDLTLFVFAEDPGAANYLIPIIRSARGSGIVVSAIATGIAAEYFSRGGISFRELGGEQPEALLGDSGANVALLGTAENRRSYSLELVTAARAMGVKSVSVVDAAMGEMIRFRGNSENPLAYLPDYILVPDSFTQNAYLRLGVSSQKIFVCGHPHFDEVRVLGASLVSSKNELRKKLFPKAKPDQKIVLFVSESAACLRPQFDGEIGRTEEALEALLEARKNLSRPIYLVLRLHPKDRAEFFGRYLGALDLVSSGGDPLECVAAADVAVGSTSMLMTEAALLKIPVLSLILKAEEQLWLPAVRNGSIRAAATIEEFQVMLAKVLEEPSDFIATKEFAPARATEIILNLLGDINRGIR